MWCTDSFRFLTTRTCVISQNEHQLTVEGVAELWETKITKEGDVWKPFGLTNDEADKRRGVTSEGKVVEGAYREANPNDPEDKGDRLFCGVNRMKPPPKVRREIA